ncbi:MAG: FeoB-associated Cys-rich membrane protein [Thermodesulfobacteriota bacterium]
MIQEIIVFIIIGAALGFMVRNIYRKFTAKNQCGCGCGDCGQSKECDSLF